MYLEARVSLIYLEVRGPEFWATCLNCELAWGIMAHNFGLLHFPGGPLWHHVSSGGRFEVYHTMAILQVWARPLRVDILQGLVGPCSGWL